MVEWKVIEDNEFYIISNLGEVRDIKRYARLDGDLTIVDVDEPVKIMSNGRVYLQSCAPNLYRLMAVHFLPNPINYHKQ